MFYIILSLLFTFNLFGMEQIIKEYPELSDFFNSQEFKKRISSDQIKVENLGPQKNHHIACMQVSLDSNGFTKKLVFNEHYINKKLMTAEEFKFVFCHELGHWEDITPAKFTVALGLVALTFGLSISSIKSLFGKKYDLCLKQTAVDCAVYLLFLKLLRDRESFADAYALKLTKNRDAGISVLNKRKSFVDTKVYKYEFLNKLRELFSDHPNEDNRIAYIKTIEI